MYVDRLLRRVVGLPVVVDPVGDLRRALVGDLEPHDLGAVGDRLGDLVLARHPAGVEVREEGEQRGADAVTIEALVGLGGDVRGVLVRR